MEVAKQRVKDLIALRAGIEEEINQCVQRLEAPGGGGRSGSLVDSEVIHQIRPSPESSI